MSDIQFILQNSDFNSACRELSSVLAIINKQPLNNQFQNKNLIFLNAPCGFLLRWGHLSLWGWSKQEGFYFRPVLLEADQAFQK